MAFNTTPVWFMPANPKPILKVALIPVFRVNYQDLEAYIKLVFGFEFDFLLATGMVGGAIPEYIVSGRFDNDCQRKNANLIKAGNRTKNISMILNVLSAEGYIHNGRYIIDTRKKPEPTAAYRQLLEAGFPPDCKECMAHKHEYRHNPVFVERAAILDKAAYAEMERGK